MTDTIRLAGIMRESIVDGPGIRFAIFCQGCPHGCPGCHNPESHDFAGGNEVKLNKILEAIDSNPLLEGVTFSGGEPMCQPRAFLELAKDIKKRGLNITIFSGYTLEQLLKLSREGLDMSESLTDDIPDDEPVGNMTAGDIRDRIAIGRLLFMCDILIDGPYVEKLRDLTLQFRGSSNQRVIDMKETFKKGEVVLWHQ